MTDTQELSAPVSGELVGADSRVLTRREDVGHMIAPLLETVPDVSEDAELRILTALLGAESPDDLDAPWRGTGLRMYVDHELVVHSIGRGDSDYPEGLGVFLVAEVTHVPTGERTTVTTGAAGVVLQLLKAHAMGAFPLKVIPREAVSRRDPSRKPMHLEVARR